MVCFLSHVKKGHAVEQPSDQPLAETGRVWYIPHHFVMNPKFTMVFDCAAAVGGESLNGQILQGPVNTNTLLGVLLRFRLHDVALVGDIRNTFHQLTVDSANRSVLRFLWWKDGNLTGPILTYQLNVHCFELTSFSSVCGFALRRTAKENRTNASEITLNRNFYVDDMLASFPSADACIQLVSELDDLLHNGGFEMAKYMYASNNVDVINAIPKKRLASSLQVVDVGPNVLPSHKVLGRGWDPNSDLSSLKVSLPDVNLCAWRTLLSMMMSVTANNRLGMAAPFVLPAKVLMQQFTKENADWNAEIKKRD